MDYNSYLDKVYEYMQYLGVPEMVLYYEPESVAQSFGPVIHHGFHFSISPRMCAIMLFSLTIHKVQESSSQERIH